MVIREPQFLPIDEGTGTGSTANESVPALDLCVYLSTRVVDRSPFSLSTTSWVSQIPLTRRPSLPLLSSTAIIRGINLNVVSRCSHPNVSSSPPSLGLARSR